MLELIGLVAGIVALGVLALPFWSFFRSLRLTRELEQLNTRVRQLEEALRSRPTPGVPTPTAGISAPLTASPGSEAATGATVFPAVDPLRSAPPAAAVGGAAIHARPQAAPIARASIPAAQSAAGAQSGPASTDTAEPDDLEARVGGRWLLYVGIAILLIGVSFFLKYAVENQWIDERGRVAAGVVTGLTLIAAGWRTARGLPVFGVALTGSGLAILYLSIYAALDFYALIGAGTAFLLMALITLLATGLADRAQAQSLAVIAAVGGYSTPFLVTNTDSSAVLLFSYNLLLGAGVLALTARHHWLALPALGYLLTVATLISWADSHYTPDQWSLVLAFLTAFCLLFLQALRLVRQLDRPNATAVTALLWTAPIAYHLAAVAVTVDHPPAIHVYLIVATVVGILLTTQDRSGWLRLPLVLAAYMPLLEYLDMPRGPSWFWPNLVTAVAIGSMHLMAIVDRTVRRAGTPLATGDLVVMHVATIGLHGLLAQTLHGPYPEWPGGAAAMLALMSAGLWFFFERRDAVAAVNAAGLSFTLVAIALAAQFEGPVVVVGWAVEGAVAAWFGVRAGNTPFRIGGLGLFALAAGRLADGYFMAASGHRAVLNERTAATAVLVILAYVLARQWRRHPSGDAERVIPIALHVSASVFTLMWMSGEIGAYWGPRRAEPQAHLTEELMRSLCWGMYGAAVVAVGMWRSLVSIRWIGIAVIGLTVLKVFFVDLSELGGIYRVVGFLVVGVLLVAVSYLYQRDQAGSLRRRRGNPPQTADVP